MASVHDFTSDGKPDADGARPVPGPSASDPERRDWLAWAFTVPHGYRVGEVTRYGGASCTPMHVEILPPGDGTARTVRFEAEAEAAKAASLRLALTRDAGLRAAPIKGNPLAGDVYYTLCALATIKGASNPLDEVDEWIDGYRQEAERVAVSLAKPDLYGSLAWLREYPYSKRKISAWLAELEQPRDPKEPPPPPPRPPLAEWNGGEWTTITHACTYVRWGRDRPGVIAPDALAGRIMELGGARWKASAWDGTTRQRRRRITAVLVRLPDTPADPEALSDV